LAAEAPSTLSLNPDNLVVLRQPILYAEQMWRAQRLWALVLFVFGVLGSGYLLVTQKGRVDMSLLIFLGYIPVALLLVGLLFYYRRRSYAQVTEEGLKVSNLLSSALIPYEQIRSARVQPLERHFEGRLKRVRPPVRPLLQRPALFVRVRNDEELVARIRKKLGTQLTLEDVIALPIPYPDVMAEEVVARLPYRMGSNLGGQRRRKRGR
jgi:hypothetical protein